MVTERVLSNKTEIKIASYYCNLIPFCFARFAPTQMENAPNFRVPFDLALCIKISVGSHIIT